MRNAHSTFGFCAVLVVVAGQSAPPRDAAPATGTASIAGHVTVLGSSPAAPVRRARVTLGGDPLREPLVADTDTDGRSRFDQLPAGSYHVRSDKPGFLGFGFGQTRPFGRSITIDLKPSEAFAADIKMPRGGALEGRILSDVLFIVEATMRMRFVIAVFVSCAASVSMSAQTPHTIVTPSSLALVVPSRLQAGIADNVDVTLTDAAGHPMAAQQDITLGISAPNVQLERRTITLLKGQSSIQFKVKRDTPGLSEIRVEQLRSPESIRGAVAQLVVAPEKDYRPTPPFTIALGVSPHAQVIGGLEKAKIIARLVDRKGIQATVEQDVAISLPELSDSLTPHPLIIAAGHEYGESTWAPHEPGAFDISPLINPPALHGSPVASDKLHVEVLSQLIGFRMIADPSWVQSFQRPTIRLKMGFTDSRGNWQTSDRDRTVVLHMEPQNGGRLGSPDLVVKRDSSVTETTFVPTQEGPSKIFADVGGFTVAPATVEFHFAWVYFGMIALLGGLAGGVIRQMLQAVSGGWKAYLQNMGAGTLCGLLAFVLGPALVAIGFKPEALQGASKIFEAFLWGFIGGGTGPALFERLLNGSTKGGQAPQAQP